MADTDPDTVQGQTVEDLTGVSAHDNEDHTTNYAEDPHDNNSHSTNYAPDQHDNAAHSTAFLAEGDIQVDNDTQSGDAAATTFTIAHSQGAVPTGAIIVPTSADAAGEFHRSNLTDTNVEITYAAAPADGTDNLTWEVITVA